MMKKYNSPFIKITGFNDESVVTTNASMAALQDWQSSPAIANSALDTSTRMVDFRNALKMTF